MSHPLQCHRSSIITLIVLVWALTAAGALDAAVPTLHWQPLGEPGSGGWITAIGIDPWQSDHLLLGGDMLGIGYSTDQGNHWQRATGLASWEIADFTYHPTRRNIVWVATMSGPYRSVDGGVTWISCRNGMPPVSSDCYSAPIQKILFDPSDDNRLLAFGGSHREWHSPPGARWGTVWQSRDGGEHWEAMAMLPSEAAGGNIVNAAFGGQSATTLYAAVKNAGVFISMDGGHTWTERDQGLPHKNIAWVATHPSNPNIAWAALGNYRAGNVGNYQPGGIFKTIDGGITWHAMNSGLGQSCTDDPNLSARYEVVVVSAKNPDVLFTSNTAWNGAGIFKSTDGGATWTNVTTGKKIDTAYPSGLSMTMMAADPRDSETIYAAGSEYLLRSMDGGKSWLDSTSYHLAGSADWRGRGYSGLCCNNIVFDPRDSRHLAITGFDHGNYWQTFDSGKSWHWGGDGMPAWGGGWDVLFCGARTIYATLGQETFGAIARSDDAGASWTLFSGAAHGLPAAGATARAVGLYALPGNAAHVWATVGGKLYQSTNGGNSWSCRHDGPGLNWIKPLAGQPDKFYVAGDAGLFRCDDGRTLHLIPNSPQNINFIAVDPSIPGRVYATCWRQPNGGLWRYDTATANWQQLRVNSAIAAVAVDPSNPQRLAYVMDDPPYHDVSNATGVWTSDDGGNTWTPQTSGLPNLRGDVLAFNPHDTEELVFGSGGSGFFVARWEK